VGIEIESLEKKIKVNFLYRGDFDPEPLRNILGFNGQKPVLKFPIEERLRELQLLTRGGYLRKGELALFRGQLTKEENPPDGWEIKRCPDHGNTYHDVVGCMHHEHDDGVKHSDLPPIDRAYKE